VFRNALKKKRTFAVLGVTLTYTSQGSNSWTTDTLTAHSTGFTDATVLFKK
jgi:hypothetical protein